VNDGNVIGIKAEKLYEKFITIPEVFDKLYIDILNSVFEAEKYRMVKLFQ